MNTNETTKKATDTTARVWTGWLKLREDGRSRKEGADVMAKVIRLSQSVAVEVMNEGAWEPVDPFDVHPISLLRALAATGTEVG